ncbi:MAG: PTS glucose transporter subunit IIA [Actinobacteria bacterium]|nr:PTS glucose transporter subunit IIA [Actinomycetota bacterium]
MQVLSPCPGRAFPITEVSDPVFAAEMVGPGIAIEPAPEQTTVVAPVSGRILKLHPHAFAMLTADGVGVLVHLGIDTVKLDGAGFEVLAEEGGTVAAGDPMVAWNPATIDADGVSTTVMVVALDRPAGSLDGLATGPVAAGEPLFSVDA